MAFMSVVLYVLDHKIDKGATIHLYLLIDYSRSKENFQSSRIMCLLLYPLVFIALAYLQMAQMLLEHMKTYDFYVVLSIFAFNHNEPMQKYHG